MCFLQTKRGQTSGKCEADFGDIFSSSDVGSFEEKVPRQLRKPAMTLESLSRLLWLVMTIISKSQSCTFQA